MRNISAENQVHVLGKFDKIISLDHSIYNEGRSHLVNRGQFTNKEKYNDMQIHHHIVRSISTPYVLSTEWDQIKKYKLKALGAENIYSEDGSMLVHFYFTMVPF